VDYLHQRGLTGQIASTFGIGYAPPGWEILTKALCEIGASIADLIAVGLASRDEQNRPRDRFRDRIIFPIRDRRGRVIAFGGRALSSPSADERWTAIPRLNTSIRRKRRCFTRVPNCTAFTKRVPITRN